MSDHILLSGIQPYALEQPCVVHIPVPGSNGLCLVLQPRTRVPASGSAAALYLHYAAEGQHLRLDYGYSNRTRAVYYHWQHDRTHADVALTRRRCDRDRGRVACSGVRYYRYRGRALLVVGRAIDEISVVEVGPPSGSSAASAHAFKLEEIALV
jgi:hypothetical protein